MEIIFLILLALAYLPVFVSAVILDFAWNWGIAPTFHLPTVGFAQIAWMTWGLFCALDLFRFVLTTKGLDYTTNRWIDPLAALKPKKP